MMHRGAWCARIEHEHRWRCLRVGCTGNTRKRHHKPDANEGTAGQQSLGDVSSVEEKSRFASVGAEGAVVGEGLVNGHQKVLGFMNADDKEARSIQVVDEAHHPSWTAVWPPSADGS